MLLLSLSPPPEPLPLLELPEPELSSPPPPESPLPLPELSSQLPESSLPELSLLPKMAAAGLKKEAFVVPTSAVGKMVVKNYVSKAGQTIEVQVFEVEEAAKNWLKG